MERKKISEAQLLEALNHLKRTDTVEFKIAIHDSDRYSTAKALNIDILEGELRQAAFFDTPDLKLSRNGIVLRARRTRKGGDTVVKLRPIVPDDLPDKLRRSASFAIELDVIPGAFIISGTLKGKAENSSITEAIRGELPIKRLFLPEQRALYKEHAPKGLDWDTLKAFGPINLVKVKFEPPPLRGRSMVAELWFYPDGTRLLELSTKSTRDEAFQALGETRGYLIRQGIRLSEDQQTKTRKALEYFSRINTGRRKAA
jgi:hypothetical protein